MASSKDKEVLVPLSLVKQILKNFKSINCGSCSQHVGYRHVMNDNANFCTSPSCIDQWLKKTEHELKGFETSSSTSSSAPASSVENFGMRSSSSIYVNQKPGSVQRIMRTSMASISNETVMKPLNAIIQRGHRVENPPYRNNPFQNKVIAPPTPRTMTTANKGYSDSESKEYHGFFRKDRKRNLPARVDDGVWTVRDSKLTESIRDGASVSIKFRWTPAIFTVTAMIDEPKILELQEAISAYCAKEPNLSENPATEQIVFALYEGDYYRAVVNDVRKGHVNVRFVDFGDSRNLSYKECKRACRKIMQEHPIYGVKFKCSTSEAVPPNLPLTKAMLDETYKDDVVIEIIRRQQWKCYGKMYFMNGDIRMEWNQMLEDRIMELKRGRGRLFGGAVAANLGELIKNETSTGTPNSSPSQSMVVRSTCEQQNYSPLMISEMELSPAMKHGALVNIIYQFNCSKLLIASVEDIAETKNVARVVKQHAYEAPFMKRVPREKEVVLAQKTNHESWYRAVIDSVDSNIVEVTFLDVGGNSLVVMEELRELSPEIRRLPRYSIVFLLQDLPEDVDVKMTPELELARHEECQIEVASQQDSLSWSGYLWVAADRTWSALVRTAMNTEKDS